MTARRVRLAFAAAALMLAAAVPHAQQPARPAAAAAEAPEYGPAKGTLVIVGGGNLNGSGINEKYTVSGGTLLFSILYQ